MAAEQVRNVGATKPIPKGNGVGITKPWAILGDFNDVLHSEDRLGGNPVTLAEVAEFQEWLDVCVLEEMASTGSTYTWNDKWKHNRVYSKLDWVFINGERSDEMPGCRAHFMHEGGSDHNPIHVSLLVDKPKQKRPFKYCNMWNAHPQLKDIPTLGWQMEGCQIYKVVMKMKGLKQTLRRLHVQYFSNLNREVNSLREKVKTVQEQLQVNPMCLLLLKEEKEVGREFKRESYLAEMLLAQRSKATWLELGDDNTNFSYRMCRDSYIGKRSNKALSIRFDQMVRTVYVL
ncbi:hypothetical protein KY290_000551 [Solanum tuberosum]|uniref:Non-LTR retroelement reverse transcriptase n=1 Tax=Solanum tuberosum TaxID=4113 RepID=A0ABQ7WJM9_SOLTU|nr:hypothetical protein KY290_000551 [Solanum tuberosum]